jgi:hypothetical protein
VHELSVEIFRGAPTRLGENARRVPQDDRVLRSLNKMKIVFCEKGRLADRKPSRGKQKRAATFFRPQPSSALQFSVAAAYGFGAGFGVFAAGLVAGAVPAAFIGYA